MREKAKPLDPEGIKPDVAEPRQVGPLPYHLRSPAADPDRCEFEAECDCPWSRSIIFGFLGAGGGGLLPRRRRCMRRQAAQRASEAGEHTGEGLAGVMDRLSKRIGKAAGNG